MSFDLTNAPTTFMDLMNWVFFCQLLDLFIIVFIDYILVYANSEVDHAGYLCKVLQTLKGQRLYAKFFKYEFKLNVVAFLGYVISNEGIMVDP